MEGRRGVEGSLHWLFGMDTPVWIEIAATGCDIEMLMNCHHGRAFPAKTMLL